ncbi:hypothetical protein LRP49_07305 [Enterovibrio sp. ZSDZ35]|uniref:Tetratricopeptide repeat-containing protein n=1 Tax=Enterovibrio qingdaonensis TaxID=2899818 RepID=A0ABT5QK14_9GAMM|nr:hypothetical protein [Enterovibrio sp. ZSDZ35]MDD1781008.1 hypothetical protein [Enterovibrio sp. ZSDZ35]
MTKHLAFILLFVATFISKGVFASFDSGYEKPIIAALNDFQAGKYSDARLAITQVLEQYPDEPRVLFWCGMLYVSDGESITNRHNFDIGIDCLKKSLSLDPFFNDAWGVLLSSLVEAGEYSKAVMEFERLWEIRELPKNDVIWTALFIVHPAYINLGMKKALADHYQQLLDYGIVDDELQSKYEHLESSQ